jgi:hypothetical protein
VVVPVYFLRTRGWRALLTGLCFLGLWVVIDDGGLWRPAVHPVICLRRMTRSKRKPAPRCQGAGEVFVLPTAYT